MRSEGYSTLFVCLSVGRSVRLSVQNHAYPGLCNSLEATPIDP